MWRQQLSLREGFRLPDGALRGSHDHDTRAERGAAGRAAAPGGLMRGERRETVAEQSVPTHAADTMAYQLATDIRALRAFVSAGALARGLSAERVELLTLAVSELATNTLQHTTGGGWVRLWAEPDQLFCDVVDQGPTRAFGRSMPAADSVRGRGLAIVEQICDEVAVLTSPGETVVRIRLSL
ncbi:ATP-binding protein [Micromonospora sp. H61]|uniref:ATP-binding protein n=1 Tax=Micromonospora sp. H61 TaxID=2824888 RepID=UPI0027DB8EB6|nr:ATP-binding protein [Micromonospora sp. H61]